MSTPRVSVIVPTYNRAATLRRAVQSVMEQSFRDLEVIVVDDASSDASDRVLSELARDARVRLVRHGTNLGAAAARNTGLTAARGALIAFQDSDDRWLPGALARLVEAIEGSDSTVGVCYGYIAKRSRFGTQLVPGPWTEPRQGDLASAMLAGNFIDLPATLIRREVFEAAGTFDADLRTLEDWELLLRMSQVTRFRLIDAVLVDSAHTPGGVNSLSPRTLLALDRIEQRHAQRIASSPAARAQLAYLRGCTHAALGNRDAMRGHLRQAVRFTPSRKYRLALAASLFGPGALDTTLAAVKIAAGLGGRRAPTLGPVDTERSPPSPLRSPLEPLAATVSVVVPTRNAGDDAGRLLASLDHQTLAPIEIIAIDTASTDGTAARFTAAGAITLSVQPERFGHGAARNEAACRAGGDILVFLTQDVVLAPDCLERLVAPLVACDVVASYGRQIAPEAAPMLERFARRRNYPESSVSIEPANTATDGVGRFFFSNACSAVRTDVFRQLGGFDERVIMNEDMNLAAAILERGGTIRYVADAVVTHGHAYLPSELFRRYFDIGVALSQSHPNLRRAGTTRAGLAYTRELAAFLIERGRYDLVPRALIELALKWSGHGLGRRHRWLPRSWARRFSLHRHYWG